MHYSSYGEFVTLLNQLKRFYYFYQKENNSPLVINNIIFKKIIENEDGLTIILEKNDTSYEFTNNCNKLPLLGNIEKLNELTEELDSYYFHNSNYRHNKSKNDEILMEGRI